MINQRLKKIQSNFNTSRAVIDALVLEKLNQKITKIDKIIAGEANEVYSLETAEGKYILRIAHREGNDFEKEKWAKEQVAKFDVSTPKVINIGFLENNNSKQYSLEQFIEGIIYDIYTTDTEILTQIFENAGAVLSKIHKVKLVGFGSFDKNFKSEYLTYSQKITAEKLQNKNDYKRIALSKNLDWDTINRSFDLIKNNLTVFDNEPSVLVHGDFNHKHFIVDEKLNIKSILDWGECRAGSPIEDFGGWQFWFGDIFDIDILKIRYENKNYFDSDFENKLQIYKIIKALDLIYYYDEIDDDSSFDFVMKKLKELL